MATAPTAPAKSSSTWPPPDKSSGFATASTCGYGQSVIDAFKYADTHGYDWVITMDCDEQHEPRDDPRLRPRKSKTDRWDIISGSRYLQHRSNDDLPPGDRRRINAVITQKLNQLLGLELTDSFCGFKAHRVSAMRRRVPRRIRLRLPSFNSGRKPVKAGLRITEIPVRLIYNLTPAVTLAAFSTTPTVSSRHYMKVLTTEMERPAPQTSDESQSAICDLAACCCAWLKAGLTHCFGHSYIV